MRGEAVAAQTGAAFYKVVTDAAQFEATMQQVFDVWGDIDVLGNNVSVGMFKPHPSYGCIVNLCSTRYLQSEAGTEGYPASEGGIYSLIHALAVSLAPMRITVNAIAPGWIHVHEDEKLRPEKHAFTRRIASVRPKTLRESVSSYALINDKCPSVQLTITSSHGSR